MKSTLCLTLLLLLGTRAAALPQTITFHGSGSANGTATGTSFASWNLTPANAGLTSVSLTIVTDINGLVSNTNSTSSPLAWTPLLTVISSWDTPDDSLAGPSWSTLTRKGPALMLAPGVGMSYPSSLHAQISYTFTDFSQLAYFMDAASPNFLFTTAVFGNGSLGSSSFTMASTATVTYGYAAAGSSVPDGGETAGLLGAGLVGCMIVHQRRRAVARMKI